MENLNNVADTLAVDILTSVVSESHREGLRIETDRGSLLEGGSVLQFDYCYTGMPVYRQLRVKNTTVCAMDVSLSSDRPGEVGRGDGDAMSWWCGVVWFGVMRC